MSDSLCNDTSAAALTRLHAILTGALAELDVLLADPINGEPAIAALANSASPNRAAPDAPVRAIPIPEWAGRARQLLPTDWPKVGGRDFVPEQTDLFRSEAFGDLWRPGEVREIYAGACEGLLRLSRKLKAPIYKVSTTGPARVWARTKQLRIDCYAAAWHDGEGYVVDDDGWDGWFPSQLYPGLAPSANSPVAVCKRAIQVQLPDTLDPIAFDRAFDAETKKAALNAWVMTPAGRDHCALVGADPTLFQRFTNYPGGATGQLSSAEEIVFFSLCEGADRLIAVAERIILRHLGLMPATA